MLTYFQETHDMTKMKKPTLVEALNAAIHAHPTTIPDALATAALLAQDMAVAAPDVDLATEADPEDVEGGPEQQQAAVNQRAVE